MNKIVEYFLTKHNTIKNNQFVEQSSNTFSSDYYSTYEDYAENYNELIREAESNPSCGQGVFKSAHFLTDGKILLKSECNEYRKSETLSKALALKKYGINIALPLYFTSADKVFKKSKERLYYEIQEEAKGSFVTALAPIYIQQHLLACNPNLKKSKITSEKMQEEYNIAIAKHRARTHLPFLSKFVSDYCSLYALKNCDMHAQNIYYSSTNGYTFFDLDYMFNLKKTSITDALRNKDIENQIKYFSSNSIKETSCFTNLIYRGYGVNQFLSGFVDSGNFSQFVYNGILIHQLQEALKANQPNNPVYNPNFTRMKDFAENGLNEKFPSNELGVFAMSPSNLMNLENALKTNNISLLNDIKKNYNLPEDFDFARIDVPNFLETMQATHEFDFANPNPAPINQSEREHVEIKENNGELEFGLV